MNPVVVAVKEQGRVPLPDLFDEVGVDRTKVVQIVQEHELLDFEVEISENRNLAYHEVFYSE